MIREKSARECAEKLLGPFQALGMVTDEAMNTATKLIMSTVELDNLQQEIERLQADAKEPK